tara:strand:+ start:202 stop:441 length:240 start_codon:yes stop_codon:yes gene_type:complete
MTTDIHAAKGYEIMKAQYVKAMAEEEQEQEEEEGEEEDEVARAEMNSLNCKMGFSSFHQRNIRSHGRANSSDSGRVRNS